MSDLPRQIQPDVPELAGFLRAFDAWAASPGTSHFPLRETLDTYLRLGKHFVPEAVTERLLAARERTDVAPFLRAFLDTALDKSDGRYDYGSYCALPVLDLPSGREEALPLTEIDRQRDIAQLALLGDLVAFEADALAGRAPLPRMRPDPVLAEKRIARGLAALRPSLARLGWKRSGHPAMDEVPAFLDWRQSMLSPDDLLRMELSLLPVHVVHDEYMFLRILQAFEANFAWIAVLLRRAIAFMAEQPDAARDALQAANRLQREAARLFPLLGTMQIAAFQDFRRYTEGASAIQSAGYKNVETLCRRPDEARLNSVAFAAVPELREAAQAGQNTLEEAFSEACKDALFRAMHRDAIKAEMRQFAGQLMRWRQAHYQIARRFLGERGGTGYTEGVPYLDGVRSVPVFREIAPER